jgi:hypothetical protein
MATSRAQQRSAPGCQTRSLLPLKQKVGQREPPEAPGFSRGEHSHYRPSIEDIRREKPHQLDARIEQLLHAKSGSGISLFDKTGVSLRFTIGGNLLPSRPQGAGVGWRLTLGSIWIDRPKGRKLTPQSRSPD